MERPKRKLSPLFLSQFEVDDRLPFQRHLNRLEVEIGREDYSHLKQVELLARPPGDEEFAAMEELTGRLLATTQNSYNRKLLERLEVRIYFAPERYEVFYLLPDRCLRFRPLWRNRTLQTFFGLPPLASQGWSDCRAALPGFACRYLHDRAGGVLLLRRQGLDRSVAPVLLTAGHGPYDPHTLEVVLYFLRTGKGDAAVINLGFSGREPLSDGNLRLLTGWGVPLNPSNIDVIYPYLDAHRHPLCYKLEDHLREYLGELDIFTPGTIIDVHGYVGTRASDRRVIVGLGGLPPYPAPEELGDLRDHAGILHLAPHALLRDGLGRLRELSEEIFVQFCTSAESGYNFAVLGRMQMLGSRIDLVNDVASLLDGEERTYLPAEDLRWLPAAGANALQRSEARKLDPPPLCLHVEIPTSVRRKMVLKLRSLEIEASLDSSYL